MPQKMQANKKKNYEFFSAIRTFFLTKQEITNSHTHIPRPNQLNNENELTLIDI